MKIYHSLSKIPFLKKYSYKFLFVAFLGIHIPLLGILFYTLFASNISTTKLVVAILGLTLAATGLTLHILNKLLVPIIKGEMALNAYVKNNTLPTLPLTYSDEVGQILKNIQLTIERLDEIDKEKQDVTELISHDLRTPVIQSLEIINFLKTDGTDAVEREEYLNLLSDISSKQLKFLDGMLKILKAKQVEISSNNFEQLPVFDIVNEVINDYRKEITSKQLEVRNNIPKHIRINGHALGIKQVFTNLLSNAIKFSKTNGEIDITIKPIRNRMQIEISDNGTGFTRKTKKTLFSKFVPGHLGTHSEPTTGLGLYLSKKIIEKHGGTIEPFSKGKDKGAKFVISLPV
ncbi:sensor histidine kinase [Winogradskyella bathintestinalis]|uniref:histidine kinase n=1 Tax=Winogradskyella bathintestinalis TaxID=3035208 RepID=A0ABT7ZRM6_9FLAO|nr:HAMP domain-containing sensor histidine kinase [Winogradskyella bathintestinalis]MDN3491661.1 HAMP domain-containing sensor histidine kinase [Winogradskyella bathintestinalis]